MEMLVQDTSIIATANALREKLGSSDLIEWVANKGFSDAIASIAAGLPNGITAIASGTYTPTSWVKKPVQIEHGMSVTPNVVFYAMEGDLTIDGDITSYIIMGIDMSKNITIANGTDTIDGHTYIYGSIGGAMTIGGSHTDGSYITLYGSNERALRYGKTYRWLAAYVEGL